MRLESQKEKRVEKTSPAHKALSVIGLLLCAIFGFMLICIVLIEFPTLAESIRAKKTGGKNHGKHLEK